MCKVKKGSFFNSFDDFHAGRFLEECLRCSGFSVEWLAEKTNSDVTALEMLFAQPNMDAELFIDIGIPMGAVFFDRMHEEIFRDKTQRKSKAIA